MIGGTFKYLKSEQFEDYMKTMNIGWMQRKAILAMSPTVSIKEEPPGTIVIKTTSGLKSVENVIVLGEEHREYLPAQIQVTAVTVKEGESSLITRVKKPNANIEIKREFTESGLNMYIHHHDKDIEAIRYFKRIK